MYRSRCYKRLTSSAIFFIALTASGASFAQSPPMTGTAAPEYAPLDKVVLEFGKMIGCQAATVAVSRDGDVLYSRGYGWRDALKKQPTKPDTIMRISGATMPFTAIATKMLVRDDKFTLETQAFEFLKLTPQKGAKPDPRLDQITVAHLLKHEGGWDRNNSFDPMFKVRQIEESLRLRSPAQPADIIRFMLGQPLQFYPGERKEVSTFGYCVLGRVIEKASGKPYRKFIQKELLDRLEIKDIKFARNLPKDRDPREVWYPGGELNVEILDSAAGLVATAPALCAFQDHYWLNGEPRETGQSGDFTSWGAFPGTTAMARQRTDGYNVAVLFNNSRDKAYKADAEQLQYLLDQALDKVAKTNAK